MEILHSIEELRTLRGPLFLAIGVFDGVHLGHQAVISTSAEHAKGTGGTPVVITFDPHPMKITRPDVAPRLLTATEHKVRLIRALGVQHLLVIHFDREFSNTSPQEFVTRLVRNSKPLREICVGHEWSFGKNRAGNLDLLKELGEEHGFTVVGIPPVKVNGKVVSSTAIRKAIETGDFATAAEMLDRDYTILGTVEHGQAVGNKIGFPTANISAHSEQFPPNGVYAAEAWVDGSRNFGVMNLGVRPTVARGEPQRTLEIHLFDFDRDIYGHDIEVKFLRFLRSERKFDSVESLQRQIEADVSQARALATTTLG
jgi:riboflavin kinase/FMN adenylyltransferase